MPSIWGGRQGKGGTFTNREAGSSIDMNIELTPLRFLERARSLYAEKEVAVCGELRLTYSEFGRRVDRLCNALENAGVNKGDRVAYLGYNCHRLLECYFGVVKMGAILLPLNVRLGSKDFEYILRESEPKVVFLDPDFFGSIEPILNTIGTRPTFFSTAESALTPKWIAGAYETFIKSASDTNKYDSMNYPFSENDTAEIFYTSGTTGKPKGVMLTHRNLYLHALAVMATFPMSELDIQLHAIPLFHVNGWGTPHYLTAKGGTHVFVRKFDAETVLKLIEKERVNKVFLVPTMVRSLTMHPRASQYDLSSLKDVLIGGSPPPKGMFEECEEFFGCPVHGSFGMSETCPEIAWPELPLGLDEKTYLHRAHETWGMPLVGVEFKIVDNHGAILPWDGHSVGELLVRGDMVMKGYFRNPSATCDAIRDGWYHTGDLASIGADGSLYIRDRKKDIIISGGENISSLELEQTLYCHPDILECAVIAKKDEKWGEVPKAIVVLRDNCNAGTVDIISFCRERLAHFKAPKDIEIIKEMPRGGTGKISKKQLRKEFG